MENEDIIDAGIVCPNFGTGTIGVVTIGDVTYSGTVYKDITTASTDSSVVAVQGGSFRNAHQDILRDRIAVINNSWFHNTTAGNRHGAALSLFDGSKATITGSSFTSNSNTSGNGGAIGGSTNASIDSMGGSELTLQNCFFANNISTGQCGGAIYGSTNSQLTISSSTFTSNTANNYGGVLYATTRVKLNISDSVFSGNIVTRGNGGAIHLEREVSATITGSTFSGNTAGVKTAGLGGAITVCFNSSLFVSGCTFAGNSACNYAGAIFVNSEGKSTTIDNCVFATKSDSIVIDTGTVSFSGTITLASDVRKENHPDRGHYLCSTDKVDFVFINEESISIAKLDNAENIRSLSFRSTEMVNFTDLALSDTILNIDCELPSLGQSLSIAGGLTSLGSGTITIHGKNAIGRKTLIDNNLYNVYLSDNRLTVTSEEYVRAAIVTSNEADWVQIGSTNYAGSSYTSINAALEREDFVVMQGSFAMRSSVTGADKRAVISQTNVTDNVTDADGGALMISEGFGSITASTFNHNFAQNGGAIASGNGKLIISGSTFTENMARQSGGAIYCTTGGTGSIENALFANNVAQEAGAAVYCANTSVLSISGSTFTKNTAASSNGGAIYLKDSTVNITDCVFSATNDTIYNDDGILTLGGTIRTAANITSTNAITVEPETKLVLDLSVYNGTTQKELLSDYDLIFGTHQDNLTISINLAEDQATGTYVLATGAADFDRNKVISVTSNGTEIGAFNLAAGTTIFHLGQTWYFLKLSDTTLSLEIRNGMGIVTADGSANTIIIRETTYTGDQYSQNQITEAVSENTIIAASNVVLPRFAIDSEKTFIGDKVSMSSLSSTNGGAISNAGEATLFDSIFLANSAVNGGAIYTSGNTEISGGTFIGNTATNGGAISLSNVVNALISNSTFSNNIANENGGALDVHNSLLTISDSVFSNNSAGGYGGAISIFGGSTVTIDNSQFLTTTESIYADAESQLILGGTVMLAGQLTSGNSITVKSDTELRMLLSGHAPDETNAFVTDYRLSFADDSNLSLSITVDSQQAIGRYLLVNDLPEIFNKTITLYSGTGKTGMVLNIGESAEIDTAKYSIIRENDSLYLAIRETLPAIVTPQGTATSVVIDGTTYTGTAKKTEDIFDFIGNVGQIAMQGGKVQSLDGQNLSLYDFNELIADTVRFYANITQNEGGAVVNRGNFTVTSFSGSDFNQHASFSDNRSDTNGGAVSNYGIFVATDTIFDNNQAAGNGGALYSNGGTVSITNAVFTGNTAANGGAVYNDNSEVTITGSTFSDNFAVKNGGALHKDSHGSLTIENCSFITKSDTVYSLGSAFTLGGTITTAAEIYSDSAITIQSETQMILDLRDYTSRELKNGLLLNYNVAFAPQQQNMTISVRANLQTLQNGKYVLASGISGDKCIPTIAVTASDQAHKLFDIDLGGFTDYNGKTYGLAIEDGTLALNVSGTLNTVYVNSTWAGLPDGTEVTIPGGITATIGANAVDTISAAKSLTPEEIRFAGGNYDTTFFAGGNGDLSDVNPNTYLTLLDGTFSRSAFAGNKIQAEENFQAVSADSTLEIHEGSYAAYVMGGDYLSTTQENVALVHTTGSRSVNISGGSFSGLVAGGSYIAGGTTTLLSQFNGNIAFTISGGTFEKRIYGGDISDLLANSPTDIIAGNIAFTLDASDNLIRINENIVCGSYGYGTIKGNVDFTVTGFGENLLFNENSVVNGGSGQGYLMVSDQTTRTFDNFVSGTSTAIFNGFQGDFTARLTLFDAISFYNGAKVSLTNAKCNLAELSRWMFADGAGVTLCNGQVNDFTNDTLNIDLTNWTGEENWTLITGSGPAAFLGFNQFKDVKFGEESAEYQNGSWVTDNFALSLSGDKKSMVLAKVC